MESYAMSYLMKKFKDDAVISKKNQKTMIEDYRSLNPDQPLPDWMEDEFSMAHALYSMAEEIVSLRKQVNVLRSSDVRSILETMGQE